MRQDVESFEDFCQYYSNHYVKSRNSEVLYYVNGKVSATKASFSSYNNGRRVDGEIFLSWPEILDTVLFGLPRVGMVVYKNELLYLYYRTDRNGGRGFDPRRIEFEAFNTWLLAKHGLRTFHSDLLSEPHFAYLATRNVHTPWEEALADLLKPSPKNPAYAVSYNFGLFLGSDPYPTLAYKTRTIGNVIDPNRVELQPWANTYRDVIQRTFNRRIEFVS